LSGIVDLFLLAEPFAWNKPNYLRHRYRMIGTSALAIRTGIVYTKIHQAAPRPEVVRAGLSEKKLGPRK
jgi:hypothetical protein